MRNAKTWNYADVTKAAEQQITQLVIRSREESDHYEAELIRQRAFGVYILWDDLTLGWQRKGDKERLETILGHR